MYSWEQMYLLVHIGFINMETCTKPERIKESNLYTLCDTMEKYILIGWPEIQDYMEHPRWSECIFCCEIEGHPCPDSTYAVPESLYNEINYE